MKSKKSTALGRYTNQPTFWDLAAHKYSHTIELETAIPQYVWGKSPRENGKYLPMIKRAFEHRGQAFLTELTPARIEDHDGVEKEYYQSKREHYVKQTLLKLMCEGQGGFVEVEGKKDVATHFSLYQVEKELARTGHTYNKNEIKDALNIMHKSTVRIESEDGTFSLSFHPIETFGLITLEDGTERAAVVWNSLITTSIKKGTFRQINYEKLMSWNTVIAGEMHKRLAHNYKQASIMKRFEILLSTVIRDFGLTAYAQLRDNLRDVERALEEMKEGNVLVSYEIHKIYDTKRRNKLIDAKLSLITHPDFNSEVIEANRQQDTVQKKLTAPVEKR